MVQQGGYSLFITAQSQKIGLKKKLKQFQCNNEIAVGILLIHEMEITVDEKLRQFSAIVPWSLTPPTSSVDIVMEVSWVVADGLGAGQKLCHVHKASWPIVRLYIVEATILQCSHCMHMGH